MRYLAIECPASREEWSVQAYVVPGEHADVAAAVLAWGETRDDIGPKPIARGQYRYDEDGAAPVSVGVVMLKGGGR